MPGRDNTLTLEADEPGTYLGQCAEYCGLSHANMRFRVIAQTPDDFEQWVERAAAGARAARLEADGGDDRGPAQELIATKYECTNCHAFDDSSAAARTARTSRTSRAARRSRAARTS